MKETVAHSGDSPVIVVPVRHGSVSRSLCVEILGALSPSKACICINNNIYACRVARRGPTSPIDGSAGHVLGSGLKFRRPTSCSSPAATTSHLADATRPLVSCMLPRIAMRRHNAAIAHSRTRCARARRGNAKPYISSSSRTSGSFIQRYYGACSTWWGFVFSCSVCGLDKNCGKTSDF